MSEVETCMKRKSFDFKAFFSLTHFVLQPFQERIEVFVYCGGFLLHRS